MKRTVFVLAFLFLVTSFAYAQTPSGQGAAAGKPAAAGAAFVDANGDGICDLYQAGGNAGRGQRAGKGYGPGDGTGNKGVGPRDGSGYGPGNGTGVCTGTCTGGGGQMRRGRRQ